MPAGKTVTVPCPKCKHAISIGQGDGSNGREVEASGNAIERPFDFVEEEGKTALICEPEAESRAAMAETIEAMEYSVRTAENTRDALKQMRFHHFDLILVNERFDSQDPDTNGVLMFLERLPISIRRNIYVGLITERYRTMDHMMAFNRSVNLTLNTGDLQQLEKILNKGIADHEYFYSAFKEAFRASGRYL